MKWKVFDKENGVHVVPDESGHSYLVTCRCKPRMEAKAKSLLIIHDEFAPKTIPIGG